MEHRQPTSYKGISAWFASVLFAQAFWAHAQLPLESSERIWEWTAPAASIQHGVMDSADFDQDGTYEFILGHQWVDSRILILEHSLEKVRCTFFYPDLQILDHHVAEVEGDEPPELLLATTSGVLSIDGRDCTLKSARALPFSATGARFLAAAVPGQLNVAYWDHTALYLSPWDGSEVVAQINGSVGWVVAADEIDDMPGEELLIKQDDVLIVLSGEDLSERFSQPFDDPRYVFPVGLAHLGSEYATLLVKDQYDNTIVGLSMPDAERVFATERNGQVVVADYNRDGIDEVAVGRPGAIEIYDADGTVIQETPLLNESGRFAITELNRDCCLDLFQLRSSQPGFEHDLVMVDPASGLDMRRHQTEQSSRISSRPDDFDNDGKDEVFVTFKNAEETGVQLLDIQSGNELGRVLYPVNGLCDTSALAATKRIGEALVFVARGHCAEDELRAFSYPSGETLWTADVGRPIYELATTNALSGQVPILFLQTDTREIYAFHANDGNVLWQAEGPQDGPSKLEIVRNELWAIPLGFGSYSELMRFDFSGNAVTEPDFSGMSYYVVSGDRLFGVEKAYDPEFSYRMVELDLDTAERGGIIFETSDDLLAIWMHGDSDLVAIAIERIDFEKGLEEIVMVSSSGQFAPYALEFSRRRNSVLPDNNFRNITPLDDRTLLIDSILGPRRIELPIIFRNGME